MRVEIEVVGRVRCDLVAYAAPNLTGKRSTLRVFPSGSQQGGIDVADLRSLVIRAPHGTRVVLLTEAGAEWEEHPWRCVRVLREHSVPSRQRTGLPGVRLPDLDLLDEPAAKRTRDGLQSSYPLVERFADGEGWTFGRSGSRSLKAHVVAIRLERDEGGARPMHPAERVARALLAAAEAGSDVEALRAEAVRILGELHPEERDWSERLDEGPAD